MGFWKKISEDLGITLPSVRADEAIPVLPPVLPMEQLLPEVAIPEVLETLPEVPVDVPPNVEPEVLDQHVQLPPVLVEPALHQTEEIPPPESASTTYPGSATELPEPRIAQKRVRLQDKPSGLSQEQIDKIKSREQKAKDRLQKSREHKAAKREAAKTIHGTSTALATSPAPASLVPAPLAGHLWKPGQSGNPTGRPKSKPVREAAEKVFLAAASGDDKNQLEKMLRLVKEKMIHFLQDDDTDIDDLHVLIQDMEIIATRLEGKPSQDASEGAGNNGQQLVINIGTRFAPRPPEQVTDGTVIDVPLESGS
jgi:hypothetical protein